MANETTLTIVGNLTDDPELRFTPTGVALAKFTVASTPRLYDRATESYKDGDALFMNCSAWRELGENIAESLKKGSRVVVTGRLRLSRWETPEGEKRSAMQLDVEDVGASLKYAQAKVMKMARKTDVAAAGGDPWATTNGKASAPQDDEPPF
ncbi:single-stranded DNA-binding protein [Catelliglobosispora koreensis]|uniref:single-stranded DNA-binding protein n=1 Tax=Catelliglobosispora koreensis TaxID=129052 RepID=UPI00035D9531|nr:single-stranded DNA-binding protein [Catelliglobosispora koreensis]